MKQMLIVFGYSRGAAFPVVRVKRSDVLRLDDDRQELAHLLTFWTRTIARSSYIRDSKRRARHSFQKKIYEGEFRVRERYSVKSNQMA